MDYSSILSKPRSFFGKQKVWMARGEDLALFNTHRSNIQNLLRHSCIPESSHNLWIGLYRVGATEDEAKTFVVVSCTDRRVRKLTRDLLCRCPIFQPGEALDRFKVISKATLPETACEPQQTMKDEDELPSETSVVRKWGHENHGIDRLETAIRSYPSISHPSITEENLYIDKYETRICMHPSYTGDNYLCRTVKAIQVSDEGEMRIQTATAGPLICLEGRTHQLTVAHLINFQERETHNVSESTDDDWDDWDEENDDVSGSSCSVDEDIASWNISARHNMISEISDDDISESLSSHSCPEITPQQDNGIIANRKETSINKKSADKSAHLAHSTDVALSGQPVFKDLIVEYLYSSQSKVQPSVEPCLISSELDYFLVPTKVNLPTAAGIQARMSKSAELVQISKTFDIEEQTEARPVIITTASFGHVEGVVFPASPLFRSAGSKNFQTLFCVESCHFLPEGTSGSAVFDKQTGFLAGHIILGCPDKNIWYMVPILNVLNDLEVRFKMKGECQIRLVASISLSCIFPTSNFSISLYKDNSRAWRLPFGIVVLRH